MASEITEEEDDHNPFAIEDKEAQRTKIRKIIDYQKSLYLSSSSSSSSSTSATTSLSSSKNSLLGLMREGSTSLGRLFDMEHTTLANYFNDYSVSPIIKPILLWGSDTDLDEAHDDPWAHITRIPDQDQDQDKVVSDKIVSSHNNEGFVQRRKRKLVRTKSYKRLPRFGLFRCGKFKFRLRFFRKLRVLIRGRIL